MKNPFYSFEFVFIVLLMLASGMGFIVLPLALVTSNEPFELTSVLIIIISLFVFGACIKYIDVTEKGFKQKVIRTIINDPNPIVHFKYSELEWKPYANKYYQKKVKEYNIRKMILVIVYVLITILSWFNATFEMLLLINIYTFLFGLLIFFILKIKFKAFKNGILVKTNPEIKITKNGILFNNRLLISYNNQDNLLGATKQQLFEGETCLVIHVQATGNSNRNIFYPYYILIPKEMINDIDLYVKKMNGHITSYMAKKRLENEDNV